MVTEQDIEAAVEKYIDAFEKVETDEIRDLIKNTCRHGILIGVKLSEATTYECPSCGEMSVMFVGAAEDAQFLCTECSDAWGPNDFPEKEKTNESS